MIVESKERERGKEKTSTMFKWSGFKYLWLAASRGLPVCSPSVSLLPPCLHFQTSDGIKNQRKKKRCYVQVSFSSVWLPPQQCGIVWLHERRGRTRQPRALKHTQSYVQIYLVKPWSISTAFLKPTWRLIKRKHLNIWKYLIAQKWRTKKKELEKIKTCSFPSLIRLTEPLVRP